MSGLTAVTEEQPSPRIGVTEDRLLGGRVRLVQPAEGSLRATLDPVLLAAAVPAAPGERVLEAGCGTGAAFLCLAARVPGLQVVAVEREPDLAGLAVANGAANGLGPERLTVRTGDIGALELAAVLGPCAHGFANPPWWSVGTPPPAARRRGATHADRSADLGAWARFLAAAVVPGGTVTLVLPAARFDAGLAALGAAGCGAARLIPLWPRVGLAAKRVLLQARKARRGPARVEPGLVLHGPGQAFTAEAEAILRGGAALP